MVLGEDIQDQNHHSNSADHRKIKAIQSGMRYDYGGY